MTAQRDDDLMPTLVGILLTVLFVIACLVWIDHQSDACERKGGTYLSREAKCVDVREIR